jgi:hypothetical protein
VTPPRPHGHLRIAVLGYIVRGPLGGLVWHHLQYVLGLVALGHDVWFVEDSDDYPGCYDPTTGDLGIDASYGLRFIADTFGAVGLSDRWAYHDAHRGQWIGPATAYVTAADTTFDVVLNLSGMHPMREWVRRVPVRALVDTDPAFTQIRHRTDEAAHAAAASHTHFLTFGENVGTAACSLPDDGFPWHRTRQPVMLDRWTPSPPPRAAALTTVMQWDSYATRVLDGREYGMKSSAFAPYMDLPARATLPLELAIGSSTAPREALTAAGWRLEDPLRVTRNAWTYQDYIANSAGEFSVAKTGYVICKSGWFSERTACYLASGRPAVVQDTGFTAWLSATDGVLPFTSPDTALAQIERVRTAPQQQALAAREVARAYFDSARVLTDLLDHLAVPRTVRGPSD